MKTLEWPGIATAVGLVAIGAIILDLSKWQQLTAGLLAFGGGLMAYRGAMAKVEHDAEQAQRELLRRQLSLYLKLDMAARRLRPNIQSANAQIGFSSLSRRINIDTLRLREPAEFAEAWDALDVFPRLIIRQIAVVRDRMRDVEQFLDAVHRGDIELGADFNDMSNPSRKLYRYNDDILDACMLIENELEPEINRLAPDTSEVEKHIARYGIPDDGD